MGSFSRNGLYSFLHGLFWKRHLLECSRKRAFGRWIILRNSLKAKHAGRNISSPSLVTKPRMVTIKYWDISPASHGHQPQTRGDMIPSTPRGLWGWRDDAPASSLTFWRVIQTDATIAINHLKAVFPSGFLCRWHRFSLICYRIPTGSS